VSSASISTRAYFLTRDNRTDSILFAGHLTEPLAS
jgi:hypothetical protein